MCSIDTVPTWLSSVPREYYLFSKIVKRISKSTWPRVFICGKDHNHISIVTSKPSLTLSISPCSAFRWTVGNLGCHKIELLSLYSRQCSDQNTIWSSLYYINLHCWWVQLELHSSRDARATASTGQGLAHECRVQAHCTIPAVSSQHASLSESLWVAWINAPCKKRAHPGMPENTIVDKWSPGI